MITTYVSMPWVLRLITWALIFWWRSGVIGKCEESSLKYHPYDKIILINTLPWFLNLMLSPKELPLNQCFAQHPEGRGAPNWCHFWSIALLFGQQLTFVTAQLVSWIGYVDLFKQLSRVCLLFVTPPLQLTTCSSSLLLITSCNKS